MSNIFEDNNEFAPWEVKKIAEEIKERIDKPNIKLYWRMYQDKRNIEGLSVVITQEEMIREVNWWNNEGNEDEDPPIFEPVFMEEKDFLNLPEFEGF